MALARVSSLQVAELMAWDPCWLGVLEATLRSLPCGPQAAHNTVDDFIRVSKGGSDHERTCKPDESQPKGTATTVVLFNC